MTESTRAAAMPGLGYSDEDRALRDTLTALLSMDMPSARMREQCASDAGHDPRLWDRLCGEMGATAIEIPEEFGGLGLGPRETAIIHHELGRRVYPGPVRESHIAAVALIASDQRAAQEMWLPLIAHGQARAGVAISADPSSALGFAVQARCTNDGWRLTGVVDWMLNAEAADVLVIAARVGSPDGELAVFTVAASAPGVATRPLRTIDLTRRVGRVQFAETPAELIAEGDIARHVCAATERAALLTAAADAAGGIDWCLDTSVRHASEREQFEQPIASFQAVSHACVELLGKRDVVEAGVRYAATELARGTAEADLALRVVALRAGQAYRSATEATVHLLGGLGFTWEHDAHYYYRRACLSEQISTPPLALRAQIADLAGL